MISRFFYIYRRFNMQSAKRVNIVSVKLVKESSMLYKQRRVRSPQDSYELFKEYLEEVDREHFVVMCLDTKNQPTNISTVRIGSLNASIVHPREVMKTAILSIQHLSYAATRIHQVIRHQVQKILR